MDVIERAQLQHYRSRHLIVPQPYIAEPAEAYCRNDGIRVLPLRRVNRWRHDPAIIRALAEKEAGECWP